jgi:hypothetical protein
VIRSARPTQKTINGIRKWLSVRMALVCGEILICSEFSHTRQVIMKIEMGSD